ncbi:MULTISPECIES: Imm49 family immunity protein [unclassified Paraburkholderia]|uniref:Imm49 family immunity protein n=1 Tax=unclassified Paraburkholderia TaxID=2615204 RepID=UPI002AB2F70C|nr:MULTISPECIES: Imm49 family immunity protein [unclassified Paraburkholderia]
MIELSREQKLLNVLGAEEKASPRQVEWFVHRRKTARLGSILCGLAGYARNRAIYAYFVERNVEKCKQNFYLASKLVLASVGQNGGASLEVGRDIQIALLSDCGEIIKEIACLETADLVRDRNNPLNNRFHVYMLQLVIRGEDKTVHAMIETIAKHGRNPLRAECAEGRDFFSLLLKGDKEGLEELIKKKHASIKGSGDVAEEFMSYRGTLETKLCWHRGICVEIEHPLVPMELMPIRPLAHYDDVYDFLKPGWMPPPQGFLDKLSRLFSNNT